MHPSRLSNVQLALDPPSPSPRGLDGVPLIVGTRLFHRRVRPGVVWAALLLGLAVLLLTSSPAGAVLLQDTPTVGEPMIAKHQFIGGSLRDGAVVRSGPSTSHLSVMTLRRDQEVVVVNVQGEFLRILPPEGTFCLVPKARVEAPGVPGQARTGKVTGNCSLKAGSRINNSPGETTARLTVGEELSIIGEDSTYYHVIPPKGVFFYVHKSELSRVREVKVTESPKGWNVGELSGDPLSDQAAQQSPDVPEGLPMGPVPPTDLTEMGPQAEAPAPAPAEDVPEVRLPTTQPTILTEIRELDERYAEAAKLPLEEQPLEELKQQYTAKLAIAEADPVLAGVVGALKIRLETIELRQEVLQDQQALKAAREKMAERQQALQEENKELEERAESSRVTVYAAVGQLQPSTLQVGDGALFRLCDPATGRTLIYLRADTEAAKNLARHLERFVGVKGETSRDEDLNLNFIKVGEITPVDPKDVFKSVAAEIVPPSLGQNADAAE